MNTVTNFSQFVGNAHTVQNLTQMMNAGRLPQTVIIEGPVGSGRKTLARLIAAGILCNGSLPCGECFSCRKVLFTGHPDCRVIGKQKDKAMIGVEQIRDIRADAFVRPVEGPSKVFILEDAMNDAAQNAFLKVLEEPPAGVHFILICRHRNDFMDTVLSRATVFSLGGVTYGEALPWLEQQGLQISEEEFAGRGGLLGSTLQQQDLLAAAGEIALTLARALAKGSRSEFLTACVAAGENRALHLPVLEGLYGVLHQALRLTAGSGVTHSPYKECAQLLSRRFSGQRLEKMAETVRNQQKKIMYNVNGNLFFTALCSELLPRT